MASIVAAGTTALIVFSATSALAATLGVVTGSFGADTKVITSCGNGMEIGYTTALSTLPNGLSTYTVDSIDLSSIPSGCLTRSLSVTFYDTAGNDVGSAVDATLPASGTTKAISIPPANTIDAGRVSGVSLVVT